MTTLRRILAIKLSFDPRQWFKKEEAKPEGVVGVTCCESGIAICYGTFKDGDYQIEKCEYAPIPASEQLSYMKAWVVRHKLKNADCHYVLNEKDYELQLLEAPPVEKSELHEAVRWRLKDLISSPVEEVALDVVPLPDDAYRGRMKMLYAVVANKEAVERVIKFIERSELVLVVVDIPEMVLRNVALYIPEMDYGTTALLKMEETSGAMLMYSHDALYLTRQIEFGYSSFASAPGAFSLDNDVMVDRLGLDLQRSLDYYESQLGKGVANKIYILPFEDDDVHFVDDLQKTLQTPILHFDCREFLPFSESVNPSIKEQAFCLPAIGSVLRRQEL